MTKTLYHFFSQFIFTTRTCHRKNEISSEVAKCSSSGHDFDPPFRAVDDRKNSTETSWDRRILSGLDEHA